MQENDAVKTFKRMAAEGTLAFNVSGKGYSFIAEPLKIEDLTNGRLMVYMGMKDLVTPDVFFMEEDAAKEHVLRLLEAEVPGIRESIEMFYLLTVSEIEPVQLTEAEQPVIHKLLKVCRDAKLTRSEIIGLLEKTLRVVRQGRDDQ